MALVYKFARPTGIKYMLENRTLCFTSLAALNDINEGMADIADIVAAESKNSLDKMFGYLRSMPDNPLYNASPSDFEGYCEDVGLTQAVFDAMGNRLGWQVTLQKFSQFGILSLTKSPTNLLMWGHYTDEGKGICIGLEASAKVFADSAHGGIAGLHDVTYSASRVKMDAPTLPERLKAAVFTKSEDWAYEKEVRCVREVPAGDKNHIVPFDPTVVQEIILGTRMSLTDVKRCHELRETVFPHAKLLHAIPNPGRFEMDIQKAPPSYYLDLLWADDVGGVKPLNLPKP